jgi:hypothetical protein
MAFPSPNIGRALLDVPMGRMIREMAFAIADAQIRLDENSIEVAEMMGGLKTITNDKGVVTFEDSRVFFGNDTVSKSAALTLHNTTKDPVLKKIIYTEILFNYINYPASPGNNADLDEADDDVDGFRAALVPTNVGDPLGDPATLYKINLNDSTDLALKDRPYVDETGALLFPVDELVTVPARVSMMELGFAPTFYQFVDTIIEVKISITYSQEMSRSTSRTIANTNKQQSFSRGFSFKRGARASIGTSKTVNTAQVNSTYASKYSYEAEGSSLMRTKLVPIPPPAILEERIRQTLENEQPAPAPESPPAE